MISVIMGADAYAETAYSGTLADAVTSYDVSALTFSKVDIDAISE